MSAPSSLLRLGISACLLGEPVRYDGRDARSAAVAEHFGKSVEWIAVCPEVDAGLGVPRPPIRWERTASGDVRVVQVAEREDLTDRLAASADRRIEELAGFGLCGFVLKERSPSCGLGDASVCGVDGEQLGARDGAFVERLRRALPRLPRIGAEALDDEAGRENLLLRASSYAAFGDLPSDPDALAAFHRDHLHVLLACAADGPADLETHLVEGGRDDYADAFFRVLERVPSHADHVRVLHALRDVVAPRCPADQRRILVARVDEYEAREVPLAEPVAALHVAVRRFGPEALRTDRYVDPGPLRFRGYAGL